MSNFFNRVLPIAIAVALMTCLVATDAQAGVRVRVNGRGNGGGNVAVNVNGFGSNGFRSNRFRSNAIFVPVQQQAFFVTPQYVVPSASFQSFGFQSFGAGCNNGCNNGVSVRVNGGFGCHQSKSKRVVERGWRGACGSRQPVFETRQPCPAYSIHPTRIASRSIA